MDKALYGLFGVILGSALTLARELLSDHRSRKKRAEYLAILISCALDRYIDQCVNVANDGGVEDPEGYTITQEPDAEIDLQSFDVDWQSLPAKLMYEILSFQNLIEEAKHSIDAVAEYVAGPPDYSEAIEERQYQFATLEIKAGDIAKELREKYNLPKRNYESWDPIDSMNKTKNEIIEQRKEREERQKPLMYSMKNEKTA